MQPFFKYHGLGNDFVVVDRRESAVDIDADLTREWCDRRRGVGADGVLVLLPASPGGSAVARMVVHNADGSVAEMCGNGLRCVVKFLAERDPKKPALVIVDTGAGRLSSQVHWKDGLVGSVTVSMGEAKLSGPHLPTGPIVIEGISGVVTAVSMGNPHLVLLDTPPEKAIEHGARLEVHPDFSQRTNVEFVRHLTPTHLQVTVWERGVGITQACGTGACAAVVASALAGRSPHGEWVAVDLPGGTLQIRVSKDVSDVQLQGPVELVFEGTLDE